MKAYHGRKTPLEESVLRVDPNKKIIYLGDDLAVAQGYGPYQYVAEIQTDKMYVFESSNSIADFISREFSIDHLRALEIGRSPFDQIIVVDNRKNSAEFFIRERLIKKGYNGYIFKKNICLPYDAYAIFSDITVEKV